MQRKILAAAFFALFALSPAFAQSQPPGQSVSGVIVNRATVNSSTTITSGNTFQTVLASNLGTTVQRQALSIENNNTSDSCWIYLGSGSATKAVSILLLPGGSYARYWPFVPSDAVQATCATSNDTIYIDVQ